MNRFGLVKVEIIKSNEYEVGKEYLAVTDRRDEDQPYGIITEDRGICWIAELIDDSNDFDDIRVELCDSRWIHWAFSHETECKEV